MQPLNSINEVNMDTLPGSYLTSEQLKPRAMGLARGGLRWIHCLGQHQEGPNQQEQEYVEEEESFEEDEKGEDAGAKAATHPLQRYMPELEGVQERQPAVPGLSRCLERRGEIDKGDRTKGRVEWKVLYS